jgi:hypothetical protein
VAGHVSSVPRVAYSLPDPKSTFKNSIKAMMARQKRAKKRSLQRVNEHFERVFNAASALSVNF